MKETVSPKTLSLLKSHHRDQNAAALLHLAARTQIRHPNSIVGRVYTARGLALMKRYREAAEILETVISPFPGLRKIYLEWLHCLKKSSQRVVWEVQAARFLTHHFSEKVCFELARHCIQESRYREALGHFRRLLEKSESALEWKPRIASAMSRCLYKLGNLKESEEWLHEVPPQKARSMRIRILEEKGEFARALELLYTVEESQRKPGVLKKIYRLCARLRDRDGQIRALEQLLGFPARASGRLRTLMRLKELYLQIGDLESAAATLQRTLSVHKKKPSILRELALIYEQLQRTSRARSLMQEYVQAKPFCREGLEDLIRMQRSLGETEQAYQSLKSAWLLGTHSQRLALDLSREHFRKGRVEASRNVLESVLQEHGGTSEVYGLLAMCARERGDQRLKKHYEILAERLAA